MSLSKERLAVIQRELGSVDQNIAGYKSANLLPDVEQSGNMAVNQANEAEAKARELSTQVYMTRHVKEYLTDGRHENQVLPSNSGINNASIQSQINDYNTRLLVTQSSPSHLFRSKPGCNGLGDAVGLHPSRYHPVARQ